MSLSILADLVFDGTRFSREPRRITVSRDSIVAIEPISTPSESSRDMIDARAHALMPGLVNTHVHVARGGMFEPSEPLLPQQVVRHFRDALESGTTTVADMGCPPRMAAALRGAVTADPLIGPSVLAAGPLLTAPAGYPLDWMPPLVVRMGAAIACHDEESAARAVESVARAGMDFVKLAVMHQSYANRPMPAITAAAARSVVRSAKRAGLRVFAHAHSSADYRLALDAGVDALMHSSFEPLDDDLLARVCDSGVYVCPTLWVFESICLNDGCALARDPRYTRLLAAPVRRSLRRFAEAYRESGSVVPPGIATGLEKSAAEQAVRVAAANLALLADRGVPIVLGNDAAYGFSLVARPVDELSAMQRAGLEPEQVLAAATRTAASMLGLSSRGRIAVGCRADLVVVDASIERDLGAAERVHEVIVAGRRIRRSRMQRIRHAARLGAAYARGAASTLVAASSPRSAR